MLRSSGRRGAAWVELLLIVAAISLLFQLFPQLAERLVGGLDFRRWPRLVWFVLNITILGLLAAVRFGPDYIEGRRGAALAKPDAAALKPVKSSSWRKEDVRVLLKRDERERARLQQRFAIYGFGVPILVVTVGLLFNWMRGHRELAAHTAGTLLPFIEADDWRTTAKGVVGVKFSVRPDRDVHVTRLGIFDADSDGLQIDRRVGIFHVPVAGQAKQGLIVEELVPYGKAAPLEGAFRWVTLAKPVELKAGGEYVLGVEVVGHVGDSWPAMFKDDALRTAGVQNPWNPLVIGKHAENPRALVATEQPWPAIPTMPDALRGGGIAHGMGNLTVLEVE